MSNPKISDQSTVTTTNPATGKPIKTYTLQTADDIQDIINTAHNAFLDWKEKSLEERAKIIKAIGAEIGKHKDELARLMAEEMGKPITQGLGEVERCINICNYTADEDIKNLRDEERPLNNGKKGIITYQPQGIILGIQPWNFPLYQVIRYAIPNLMAGNAVLLKHAENVWGMAEKAQDIMEQAGLPKRLFTSLFIHHGQVEDILAHRYVRGLTLTGSATAGRTVAAKAAKYLKKTVLELGGSDPYIVLEDADIDKAVKTCTLGRTGNTGQTCIAAKRFIVMESIYDTFKEKFVTAMEDVTYGDPLDPATKMGAIARKDLRDKLHAQVLKSIEKGATCLTGGKLPDGDGYFYPSTVLENIKPGMPAYNDELFGPVASLFKVKNEDEAIQLANDHCYGLGGGVISENEDRAIAIAKRIDTGMVSINGYFGSQPNLPFGGVKDSGYGREHGGFGIREFVNIKSIYVGNT